MTSHGSVSIASFDRLKMFPHPVTVKATAFTDVGESGRLIGQSVFIKYLSPEINTQHSIERDQNGGWVKNTWQVL